MGRSLLIFVMLLLGPLVSSAQWRSKLGVNVVPVIAKTLEVTSEFSNHPSYSLHFNAGYTFSTSHIGMIDYDVFDGVKDRKTSGVFAKIGARFYPLSIKGREPRNSFFVGGSAILSQYRQTAMKTDVSLVESEYVSVSAKGITVAPALSLGFTSRISKRLALDWGVQKSFLYRKNDFIGRQRRNYQPGMGSGQSSPFMGYLQGIVAIKFQL